MATSNSTSQEAGKSSVEVTAIIAEVPVSTVGSFDAGVVTVQESGKAPTTQQCISGTVTKV